HTRSLHDALPISDRRLGEPLPHQLANPTRAHPMAINLSPLGRIRYYPRFPWAIPYHWVGSHALLTRLPLPLRGVRLACVRPAASVRSEPGSNSQVEEFRFWTAWRESLQGSLRNGHLHTRRCHSKSYLSPGASMVMAETQFSPESRLALSTREGDCRARQDSAACVSLSSRLTCQRTNPWSANPPQRASGTMKLPPDPTGGVSRRLNGNLAPRPGQRGVSASRQGGFYSNPLPLSTPDFTTSEILFAGPHR